MAEELEPCPRCGALPCDWVDNPHTPPTEAQVEAAAVAVARVDAPPFTAGSNDGRNIMRHYKRLARAALEAAGRA